VNLMQLLRSQAKRYRCPECSKSMANCGIAILVQQGNHALVRVTCKNCRDENLLKIVLQGELAEQVERPSLFDEPRPEVPEPIALDEVLDLHAALERWDGDLRTILVAGKSA
jgi:hypothetical protein